MGLSRQVIALRRLLAKCELMIKGNNQDERFPKYVGTLEEMLKEILKSSEKPQEDAINDYKRRIYNIKVHLGLEQENDKRFLLNEYQDDEANEREELLGVRQRTVHKSSELNDLDEVIGYHENMQNKIAEDMLTLTANLKEQSRLANKIIKKDTEIVGRSAQMTEQNFSKLKLESDKLSEHSKRACKCWMWIILLIVMVVFVNMVMFMKVMKKK